MNSILQKFVTDNQNTPIWLMRQAGRYLPEYLKIRNTVNNFLDLCYDQNKVVEITLQPIKRFNLSAAIIFSDILILPHALGWQVEFVENIGPVLAQFKSAADFKYLDNNDSKKLQIVYDAIAKTKANLPNNIPLIGFAGSPWTVVSYLLEGRGQRDFLSSKKFIYQNRKLAKQLTNLITEKTIQHLIEQIKAGVDLIQLFDSWAGILNNTEYNEFVIEPTVQIVTAIKNIFPNIPVIGFPKGSGFLYEKYITDVAVDVIGVDQSVPVSCMRKWQDKIMVQGNLDPVILLTTKEIIAQKADEILSNLSKGNFIFNLGHGILPQTDLENVEFLVNYVREYRY